MLPKFSPGNLLTILVSFLISTSIGEIIMSCQYPPCRYNVYRDGQDVGNLVVKDASSHVISWIWEVLGGRWNVTYHYIYPGGWYEGMAQFINCSNFMDGKAQPYVSWGSSKAWDSNAIPIYAHAWNITYNGDVFGFVPTGDGKYVFHVYTKNKRHNPFSNEALIVEPGSCHFTSSDKAQIKAFWAERKRLGSCEVTSFDWSWYGQSGRWRVQYKWTRKPETISCTVYYTGQSQYEQMIISWELDIAQKGVAYKSNPVKIYNEAAWSIDLSPEEYWGFSPVGQGSWVFQHFSRNLVFQPFKV